MGIVLRMLFALCVVVAPIVVWTTSADLPASVASHFGRGGYANGFMPKESYRLFMLALTTALPLFVVATIWLLPRAALSRIARGNREHWLAPTRREETTATLASAGCVLGMLLIVFLTSIHLMTLAANARTPPHLDESTLFAVLIVFLVMLVAWMAFMALRFGTPRKKA